MAVDETTLIDWTSDEREAVFRALDMTEFKKGFERHVVFKAQKVLPKDRRYKRDGFTGDTATLVLSRVGVTGDMIAAKAKVPRQDSPPATPKPPTPSASTDTTPTAKPVDEFIPTITATRPADGMADLPLEITRKSLVIKADACASLGAARANSRPTHMLAELQRRADNVPDCLLWMLMKGPAEKLTARTLVDLSYRFRTLAAAVAVLDKAVVLNSEDALPNTLWERVLTLTAAANNNMYRAVSAAGVVKHDHDALRVHRVTLETARKYCNTWIKYASAADVVPTSVSDALPREIDEARAYLDARLREKTSAALGPPLTISALPSTTAPLPDGVSDQEMLARKVGRFLAEGVCDILVKRPGVLGNLVTLFTGTLVEMSKTETVDGDKEGSSPPDFAHEVKKVQETVATSRYSVPSPTPSANGKPHLRGGIGR